MANLVDDNGMVPKRKQQEAYLTDTSKKRRSYIVCNHGPNTTMPWTTYSPLVVTVKHQKTCGRTKRGRTDQRPVGHDQDTPYGLEDHLTKFKHLVVSHQSHDLATKLLRSLPDTTEYLQLRRDLKREALHKNKGRLKLREIYAEIQTTARINRQWSSNQGIQRAPRNNQRPTQPRYEMAMQARRHQRPQRSQRQVGIQTN